MGIIGFASLVHGTIGIGFPLVATPLLAMFTDVRTAMLILVIPTVLMNMANILKGGGWNSSIARYWPLAVYGMIGSFIGTHLLIFVSPDFFRPVLAVMLLFYLNADRLGIGFPWIHRYPRLALAVSGLLAGVLGGTVNIMLPALIIYALEVKMLKLVMIQVFNLCFLLGKLTQGTIFLQKGLITKEIVCISLPLALLGLMIMFLGMTIRDRIDAQTYRRWLRRLLAVMALILMIKFF